VPLRRLVPAGHARILVKLDGRTRPAA